MNGLKHVVVMKSIKCIGKIKLLITVFILLLLLLLSVISVKTAEPTKLGFIKEATSASATLSYMGFGPPK